MKAKRQSGEWIKRKMKMLFRSRVIRYSQPHNVVVVGRVAADKCEPSGRYVGERIHVPYLRALPNPVRRQDDDWDVLERRREVHRDRTSGFPYAPALPFKLIRRDASEHVLLPDCRCLVL